MEVREGRGGRRVGFEIPEEVLEREKGGFVYYDMIFVIWMYIYIKGKGKRHSSVDTFFLRRRY